MKTVRILFLYFVIVITSLALTGVASAHVPVRISIKFILDVNGNRPATGNLNTDEEILAEYKSAIDTLGGLNSELTVEKIEFVDLAGLSQWYSASAATTGPRDAIRTAAIADPATYHWRTDAINIYITGGQSSAISDFPPTNNVILMNQWCGNTPSCMLHEMGHSMNLMHTHEPCCGGDGCTDTIADNSVWTKDQLASNNYGCLYANCNATQKAAVDMVFNNVMSYHVSEPQLLLSPCQMDRISTQTYSDRGWLLSKTPIYVDKSKSVPVPTGSFGSPYTSLQSALTAGGLANKVLVIEQGAYSTSQQVINYNNLEIVTRSRPSTISYPGIQLYNLPVDLENSNNSGVANAIRSVQDEDRLLRNVEKEAVIALKNAIRVEDKASIRSAADARKKIHRDNAVNGLLDAEKYAEKDDKIAIQLELAQRYRDSGDCDKAVLFFRKVSESTDQPHLSQESLRNIEKCKGTKVIKAP